MYPSQLSHPAGFEAASGKDQVQVFDKAAVGRHNVGNGTAVLPGDRPEGIALLYGVGHIGGRGVPGFGLVGISSPGVPLVSGLVFSS